MPSAHCWEHALWWSNSYQVINLCSWCFQWIVSRIASVNFINMKYMYMKYNTLPHIRIQKLFLYIICSETSYVEPHIKDYEMIVVCLHLIILSENTHTLELIWYFSSKWLADLVGLDLLKTMHKQVVLMKFLLGRFLCYWSPTEVHILQDSAVFVTPLRNFVQHLLLQSVENFWEEFIES